MQDIPCIDKRRMDHSDSAELLEKKMAELPFKKHGLYWAERRLFEININPTEGATYGRIYNNPAKEFPDTDCFFIMLGMLGPCEEREITLIHELLHQFYCMDSPQSGRKVESRINEEAIRLQKTKGGKNVINHAAHKAKYLCSWSDCNQYIIFDEKRLDRYFRGSNEMLLADVKCKDAIAAAMRRRTYGEGEKYWWDRPEYEMPAWKRRSP